MFSGAECWRIASLGWLYGVSNVGKILRDLGVFLGIGLWDGEGMYWEEQNLCYVAL